MLQYDNLKQVVKTISFVTEEDWQYFEPFLSVKQFAKNEYFIKSGETEKQIGFINKGSFRWYYINNKGNEVNFHFFLDNVFIVEYGSFLAQQSSEQYIQAMEDSEVILLPKYDRILEIYSESHRWSEFGRKIAEKVYLEAAERVKDFLYRDVEERYTLLLKQRPDIFQRVSLSNIASYLGIQPPSLSRLRRRISKQ